MSPSITQRIHPITTVLMAVLGVGAAVLAAPPTAAAQQQATLVDSTIGRLSIRPAKMATGKRTEAAGIQRLDSVVPGDSLLRGSVVYVPKRCVGKRRCALAVVLHGGAGTVTGLHAVADPYLQPGADSLGIIMVGLNSRHPDGSWGNASLVRGHPDVANLDATMRAVLAHYAIDPKRILLIGSSAGAGGALDWGYVNGDVFSHVLCFSAWGPFNREHEFDEVVPHGKANFYFASPWAEGEYLQLATFVPWMQRLGYSAAYATDDDGHGISAGRGAKAFEWLVKTPGWR